MTVSTTESRIGYNGNGATTAFAFPYRFLVDADLVVTLVRADTTQVVQTLNTDYTVTGAGDDAGGTVTMVVPPATGQQLVIVRDVPLTQETDYISGDPFPAESHERALDKLTMISQRLNNLISRSIRLSDADLLVTSTILPAPSPGSSLIWNLTGTGLVNGVSSGSFVGLSPYMEVVLGSVDSAEALTNLGAVKLTGAQTVAGVKTFSDRPIIPDGTAAQNPVSKAQLDAAVVPATLAPTLFVETTPQPLNGLAAVEWSAIPSWARELVIVVSGQSSTTTGVGGVRIGTGGAAETSGYSGAAAVVFGSTAGGNNSTYWRLTDNASASAAAIHSHRVTITKVTGNTWLYDMVGATDAGNGVLFGGGTKALAGVLDMVQLIMSSGSFDGGTATLYYR